MTTIRTTIEIKKGCFAYTKSWVDEVSYNILLAENEDLKARLEYIKSKCL